MKINNYKNYLASTSLFLMCMVLSNAVFSETNFKPAPSSHYSLAEPSLSLKSFALNLQDYLSAKQTRTLTDSLHRESFVLAQMQALVHYTGELPESDEKKNSLYEMMKTMNIAVFTGLEAKLKQFDVWTFVHHRTYEGRSFILYRVETEDEEFSFFELEVKQFESKWVVTDWFNYSTDIWFSETIGGIASILYSGSNNTDAESLAVNNFLQRRFDDGLESYANLTMENQKRPILQSLLVGFSIALDHDNFNETMEKLLLVSPENRFLLTKMTYFSEKEEYRRALDCIRQLSKDLGGESNLELMRAEILFQLGESKAANRALAKAIRLKPKDETPYYTALFLLAGYQYYGEAVLVLDVLQEEFEFVLSKKELAEFGNLDDFLESEQYRNWLKSHAA